MGSQCHSACWEWLGRAGAKTWYLGQQIPESLETWPSQMVLQLDHPKEMS